MNGKGEKLLIGNVLLRNLQTERWQVLFCFLELLVANERQKSIDALVLCEGLTWTMPTKLFAVDPKAAKPFNNLLFVTSY